MVKLLLPLGLVVFANGQSCNKPDEFENGFARCGEGDEVSEGSNCMFLCDSDYVLQGDQILTCVGGVLNGDIPTCIHKDDIICDTCCNKGYKNIENASHSCTKENNKKSKCSITCNQGYTIVGEGDEIKCTNDGWNKLWPECVAETTTTVEPTTIEPTTIEPPLTTTSFALISTDTPNFGFKIVEDDPDNAMHRVAWNQGLYVDENDEVQFGQKNLGFPGVRRQWLRYTDTISEKRNKVHFDVDEFGYTLYVPDLTRVYKLQLMVKFENGMVFADTKYTGAGKHPTTTTTTTTTTTEEPTTTTSTLEPATTYFDNLSTLNLRAEDITGTTAQLLWNTNQAKQVKRQWLRYVDQFDNKQIINVGPQDTRRKVSNLTPGYLYKFEVFAEYQDGRVDRAFTSAMMTDTESGGAKCVVCNSSTSNEECNLQANSCDVAQNQVCQTVVRVENNQPPRFEKRCKQRQACNNESAIYRNHGICKGGDRSQLVDVCVYCCEGDYCNVTGEWMDTLNVNGWTNTNPK